MKGCALSASRDERATKADGIEGGVGLEGQRIGNW
jgi:hypothetical protein